MSTKEEVRTQVRQAYGRAITSKSTCCGGSANDTYARTIGYEPEEVAEATEAAGATMGCGNPLAFSGVQPGETVLDLGSGAGLDLLVAAEKVGPSGQVIGVDMTPEMIAAAQANIAASGYQNIEVRQGIIENLPVDDGSVNWVISNCVINLSPEKEKVFAELFRVLRPGGRFSISDIVVSDLPETVRDNPALYNSCIAGAISEEEYLAGLAAAGLREVKVTKRFAFTLDELDGLDIDSLFSSASTGSCGCGDASDATGLEQLARQLSGRVQSLNFTGRKPL